MYITAIHLHFVFFYFSIAGRSFNYFEEEILIVPKVQLKKGKKDWKKAGIGSTSGEPRTGEVAIV